MKTKKRQKVSGVGNTSCGKYHDMYGIRLFGRTVDGLLILLEERWGKQVQWVATVNTEFVMNALKDRHFMDILQNKTTVNVIDGVGLVWGNRVLNGANWIKTGVEILLGQHRETIVTGVDLMDQLCRIAADKGRAVYFFGGWGDRGKKTAEHFLKKYPTLKVSGYKDEDFDFETKTDYLFVARGMKKQEEWIDANLDKLKVNLVMGVGRSFDYYSGALSRAPKWVRRMGLEWLYSLIKEPSRWRRQLELPKFIWRVLKNQRS